MSSDLLKLILTSRDVEEILAEIVDLEKTLYLTDPGAWDHVLDNRVRGTVAEIIRMEMEGKAEKKRYLADLRSQLKGMVPVRISVAVDLPAAMVKKIALWVKSNVGAENILDLQVDPELLGGATIAYGGKYGNYSLRDKLERFWDSGGQDILRGAK